jgi:hypothetical protein
MSEYIQLEPKGIVLYKYDSKREKYVRQRPKKLTILTHLRSDCKIKEGTTLKDIFHGVEKYKLLKLVISQYSWCREIDEFHAQAEEPMRSDPSDTDPLSYLEIYWHPEVHLFNETIKHTGGHKTKLRTACFDASCGFHGIGPVGESRKDDPFYKGCDTINYSVSYSPMWKLADLPVKLNKEFTIYEPFPFKGKAPESLLKAKKDFCLLDILDAIYYDISFMGGPADNAEFIEEMCQRVEDIKSGVCKTIPWDDVKKELDEKYGDDEEEKKEEKGKYEVRLHPDVASALGYEEENKEDKDEESNE